MPADPVQALRVRHRAQGLTQHARTACPNWQGEHLELAWAIGVSHPFGHMRIRDEDPGLVSGPAATRGAFAGVGRN